MAATVYALQAKQGRDLFRSIQVELESGTLPDAVFTLSLWPRHHPETPISTPGTIAIQDVSENMIQLHVPKVITAALDPVLVYAYQIDAEAQDGATETIAQGRFYVEAAYSEA